MSSPVRLTIAALVFSASAAAAQNAADALDPVRQLYASADYEEALKALGRLQPATPSSGVEIDRYRALCLIALNRSSEADRVIESIVAADPLYQPSATDAAQAFEKTVRVIDTIESPAKNELADLRVLASGFLDLSKAAAAPPAPAAPRAPDNEGGAAPPPTPTVPRNTGLVVLKQDLPPLPFSIAMLGTGEYRGEVEVQIDEGGNVTGTRIIQPVHAIYDPILLKAMRDWKYEAPRVAGRPFATVKRVEIVLKP